MTNERQRREPDEARAQILDAAAALLAEDGLDSVTVRAVARRVGMTDAGVNHHFGNRDQLLQALLRHGGRRLRIRLDEVVAGWVDGGADVAVLVDVLARLYSEGYAELALALHSAGWRDRGSGLLDPVVDALHARRRDPSTATEDDSRLAVAALHQAIALEPVYGSAFRRSAGFSAAAARESSAQHAWWVRATEAMLGLRP